MKLNRVIIYLVSLFLLGCEQNISTSSKKNDLNLEDRYKNLGFALVYDKDLMKIKKLDDRSLDIFHKSLKRKSIVKTRKICRIQSFI